MKKWIGIWFGKYRLGLSLSWPDPDPPVEPPESDFAKPAGRVTFTNWERRADAVRWEEEE